MVLVLQWISQFLSFFRSIDYWGYILNHPLGSLLCVFETEISRQVCTWNEMKKCQPFASASVKLSFKPAFILLWRDTTWPFTLTLVVRGLCVKSSCFLPFHPSIPSLHSIPPFHSLYRLLFKAVFFSWSLAAWKVDDEIVYYKKRKEGRGNSNVKQFILRRCVIITGLNGLCIFSHFVVGTWTWFSLFSSS